MLGNPISAPISNFSTEENMTIAGLTIDSTDATMQRKGTFSLTYTSPNIVSTSLNTTLTSGNDTLGNPVVTANGGDSYTADFPVGDLTKQVDATGYPWTLEITP